MNFIDELLKDEKVEWKKLEEVCKFQNGFAFPSNLFSSTGIPVIKINNISDGKVKFDNYKCFESETLGINLEEYKILPNDILITMTGTTKIGYNYSENIGYLNQRVGKIIPFPEKIKNRFLFHLLLFFENKIYKLATGAGPRPNLSAEQIKSFKVPLPPLKKQAKIAAALDKFTELTEELTAREAQYDYYRNMLLIDQWNDKNIKFENAEIIRTTVGDIIERCSEKAKNDKNVATVYTVSSEFGLIPSIDYWKRKGSKNKKSYKMFSDDTSNYNIVRKNMFAYNPARLNIGSISCLLNEKTGLLSPMYNVFKIKENIILPKYLLYFLKTPTVINKIDLMKESGARNRFDFEKWKKIEISIPAIEIQKKIIEFLDSFETLVNDIRQGLPREIELRQKQYEYYREKLLTFE